MAETELTQYYLASNKDSEPPLSKPRTYSRTHLLLVAIGAFLLGAAMATTITLAATRRRSTQHVCDPPPTAADVDHTMSTAACTCAENDRRDVDSLGYMATSRHDTGDNQTSNSSIPLGVTQLYGRASSRMHVTVTFPKQDNVSMCGLVSTRLLLDTGSSTLALCNATLASSLVAQNTSAVACNSYGNKGSRGFNGYFQTGQMAVGGYTMMGPYASMRYKKGMSCWPGYDGIFGIAYASFDQAYRDSEKYPYSEQTTHAAAKTWCATTNSSGVYTNSFQGALQRESARMYGIYWSGVPGDNTGSVYMGLNASHYNQYHYPERTVTVAAQKTNFSRRNAERLGYYSVKVSSFSTWSYRNREKGETSTDVLNAPEPYKFDVNPEKQNGVIDTGTPYITVPRSIYEELTKNSSQYLVLQLEDDDGKIYNLTLGTGAEMLILQYLHNGTEADGITLGVPLWKYFYTIMDEDSQTIAFSRLTNVTAPASCEDCPAECTGGCWYNRTGYNQSECTCRIDWDKTYRPVFCPPTLSCEIVCNDCRGSIFHCPPDGNCTVQCLGETGCEAAYFYDASGNAPRATICNNNCENCPPGGDCLFAYSGGDLDFDCPPDNNCNIILPAKINANRWGPTFSCPANGTCNVTLDAGALNYGGVGRPTFRQPKDAEYAVGPGYAGDMNVLLKQGASGSSSDELGAMVVRCPWHGNCNIVFEDSLGSHDSTVFCPGLNEPNTGNCSIYCQSAAGCPDFQVYCPDGGSERCHCYGADGTLGSCTNSKDGTPWEWTQWPGGDKED